MLNCNYTLIGYRVLVTQNSYNSAKWLKGPNDYISVIILQIADLLFSLTLELIVLER